MRKWITLLCSCACWYCTAQSIDSFPIWKQELQGQPEPLQRRQLLLKISEQYDQVSKDSSIAYGIQAFSWSQQLQDTPTQIYILTRLGSAYYFTGAKDKSIEYHNHALQLATASGNEQGISNVLEFLAGACQGQSDFKKALEYEQMALDHARRSTDTSMIGNVYANLAGMYSSVQKYDKTLYYFTLALSHTELDGFPELVNLYLGNIAATYFIMGQIDNAAIYYHCQLAQSNELHDSLALALCYLSLGAFYGSQADYPSALRYHESAISIYEKVNSKGNLGTAYDGMSDVYKGLHQFDKAIVYNQKAIELSRLFGQEIINNSLWEKQSELYEKTHQPEKALAAYKQFILYRDSSFNVEKKTAFARQEIQYDFDKQTLADSLTHATEMSLNQLKLQRQRIFTFSGLGGFILVLSTLLLLYRSYRQKQKTNRELAIAKARAEQSEKFKQQFLANMSHEIRTPMNVVLGMTDLALDTPLNPKQKNYLTGIKRASSNLLHIINDILDLSKVEAGKLELEKIGFSIRDVVNQANEILHQKAIDKGIELLTVIDADVPDLVTGDPNLLHQVILNLAGNAIKFTDRGKVILKVDHGTDPNAIRFSIMDTGIGIPKEKQGQIFESFTQAHSSDSRRYGGTGLGLSISRQLIELMGGTLSLQSEEGRGSTFSFEVPLPSGSINPLGIVPSKEQVDATILNGLRILLADDHEDNRIVAIDTLQSKCSVDIAEATNGKEVIELLQHQVFDIILMDVQMPVMDGYETTRQIRNTFPSPKNNIPIIALTASVIRSDLDKCREAGMNDYVPKPFKTNELIIAIAKATGRTIMYTAAQDPPSPKTNSTSWPGKGMYIDLRYLESFCEGDKMKMRKYISLFIDHIPGIITRLKDAAINKNLKDSGSLLHGIRTQLTIMGMQECLALTGDMENDSRSESVNFDVFKSNLERLISQVENAIIELKSFISS